jgi:3-phenylpropionate/trans-cinnamate dioxygenase ferredoxin component
MTESRLVDVYSVVDLEPGTMRMVQVDNVDILLVNAGGTIHAMQGLCSHQENPLDEGELNGSTLTCARHYSEFDVRDGSVLMGPADRPLVTYPVVIAGDRINLRLPIGAIPVNE